MIYKDSYFIDTSGFIGLFIKNDRFHKTAHTFFRSNHYGKIYTNEFVISEIITLLRCKEKIATKEIQNYYEEIQNTDIEILPCNETLKKDALHILYRYTDQYFSFTDCMSFAHMKKHDIEHVLTGDKHFKTMGFQLFTG